MGRITLQGLQAHEVELPGGHVYTVKPATRAVVTKAGELDQSIEALVLADDLDGIVGVYGELLNLRLAPVAAKQQHAGTVIKQLWKSDKVTVPQIQRLLQGISETDRPT